MNTRHHLVVSLVLIALLTAQAAWAVGENIALHKPYTWTADPIYSTTRDPCDITQLTDGVILGAHHSNVETVGWHAVGGPVSVTIDLGSFEAIEGFGLSAGIYPPAFVYMWVSQDGVTFSWAGELYAACWASGLPDGGALRGATSGSKYYTLHGQFHAGRYVKFTLFTATGFCSDRKEQSGG